MHYICFYFSFWLFFVHTNLYLTINLSWTWYLWSIKTFMFTVWTIGYNEFNSFILLTPLMVAKFNFKTVYNNRISAYWAILCAFTFEVSKKCKCDWKRRILCWFRIGWKNCKKFQKKKVFNKNVTEICTFFTFTHVRQFCFVVNLFCFNGFENTMKFSGFWYP